MSREDAQMKIRLPSKLRDRIAEAADAGKRSLNAEIVTRLDMSFVHEVEGRESDNRSLRDEVMELRYGMLRMVEAMLLNDKTEMKQAVQEIFESYGREMKRIEEDGAAARQRYVDKLPD